MRKPSAPLASRPRSAAALGCTHVLVLRSYPDGRLLPRSLLGIFENWVAPKCIDAFPATQTHMQNGGHSLVYAQDMLCLNEAARMAQAPCGPEVAQAPQGGAPIQVTQPGALRWYSPAGRGSRRGGTLAKKERGPRGGGGREGELVVGLRRDRSCQSSAPC